MAEAYIVDAVRTAGGKRGGKLAGWHPVDMAAAVLDALAPLGVTDLDMPLTPEKVWRAIRAGHGGGGPAPA